MHTDSYIQNVSHRREGLGTANLLVGVASDVTLKGGAMCNNSIDYHIVPNKCSWALAAQAPKFGVGQFHRDVLRWFKLLLCKHVKVTGYLEL